MTNYRWRGGGGFPKLIWLMTQEKSLEIYDIFQTVVLLFLLSIIWCYLHKQFWKRWKFCNKEIDKIFSISKLDNCLSQFTAVVWLPNKYSHEGSLGQAVILFADTRTLTTGNLKGNTHKIRHQKDHLLKSLNT